MISRTRLATFLLPAHRQAGQTMVEVLVAMSIAALLLPALATALIASREGRAQQEQRLQATALLRETTEAVRSAREKAWSQIAVNGTYHPVISANSWSLTAGAETIGSLNRQVIVSDARRDAAGAIVAAGGTIDPSTKKIDVSVSWTSPLSASIASTAYYQRHLNNTAWTQTTQAEFNGGTFTETSSANTAGGEVRLTPGPVGMDWTSPAATGTFDAAGTEDATDVFVSGSYSYLADSTVLRIVNITNPAAPVLTGSFTATGVINGISVVGNFAYLATASDTAELTVVNITNKAAPVASGTINLVNTTDCLSVDVDGNYAYLTRVNSLTAGVNEFVIIDITAPATPVLSGSLNLTAAANDVAVSGNFAYLATAVTTAEMTVVNITNKAVPASAGVYNTTGVAVANGVFAIGTTVYLVKATDAAGPEFFILNAANPAAVTLTGSYEAAGTLNGVFVAGNRAFLATTIANAQLRILNVITPATPTVVSSFNVGAAVSDIYYDAGYINLAGTDNAAELRLVNGITNGSFESSTFDATANAGFNYLTFGITEPTGTNITFQIATNSNNSTWNFVGPDGTAGTSYTAAGPIPLTIASNRYIRYKATMSGPGAITPLINDVVVNYSP